MQILQQLQSLNLSSYTNITERFFELPKNADPILKRIVEDLKQKNSLHPFVEQFVKNEGLPVWKYAKITIKRNHTDNVSNTEGTDTLVSVPIVPDGDAYVKDVLKVKINTEVLYKLFMGEQYASNGFDKDPNRTAPNAEDIVKQIMAFEKEMYYSSDSTVIYHIKDNRLFDNWPADTTKPQDFYMSVRPVGEICPIIEITYISGWEFCSSGKGISSNITKPKCPIYTTLIIYDACYDDEGGEGGWTTYPQGEPGGGEGTTTPDSTTNPPNTLPGECGEDRNWVVYVIDTNTGEWKNPCTQEEPPIEWPDEPGEYNLNNPCDVVDSLLTTNIFKQHLKDLRDSTPVHHEKAISFTIPDTSIVTHSYYTGQGVLEVTVTPASPVDGIMHNHYDTSARLPIFSADDIVCLAYHFVHNEIKNIQTFTYTLVTNNTSYIIMIEDASKFMNFVSSWFDTDNHIRNFRTHLYRNHNVGGPGLSDADNERNFLQALAAFPASGCGLKLFRGNSGMTVFSPIKINATGQTEPDPCN